MAAIALAAKVAKRESLLLKVGRMRLMECASEPGVAGFTITHGTEIFILSVVSGLLCGLAALILAP